MTDSEKLEKLLREFYAEQTMLKGYVYAAIRDFHATEDIMQEMAIVIAQKAAGFDFERPAVPWFVGVAKNQVLRWFQSKGRKPVHVSFDLLNEAIAQQPEFESAAMAAREAALGYCVVKLPQRQQRIIRLRYVDGHSCDAIAETLHQSVQSIYALLKRTKSALRECVELRLKEVVQ
jgi:RNA polymerase sigma-70 factor (ECF subfamily)